MFLSANNFFGGPSSATTHTRVAKWRDVGRPKRLIGVQYIGNDDGTHRGAYHVRNTRSTPGSMRERTDQEARPFQLGIEIDKTAPSSPQGTHVLANPNLLARRTGR
jgi:hypothetical protein